MCKHVCLYILSALILSSAASADLTAKARNCKRTLEQAPIYEIISRDEQRARLTPALIRKAIKALGFAGFTLKTNDREELKNPIAKKIIGRALGFEMHPRVLLETAVETFGSMQIALWTKTEVKAALQSLYKKGFRPNSRFFKYTKSTPELLEIIRGAVGFETDFYSVYSQAKRLYGNSFKAAMQDAGLPVDKLYHVRASQPWTQPLIYKALKALHQNGYRPKLNFLQNSKDERALNLVVEAVGFKTTLSSLLNYARDLHDGKFENALTGAGLPLEDIYQVDPRTPWDPDKVLLGLKALYSEGFSPNASFLQTGKDAEAAEVLKEAIGFEAPLSSLYNKSVEHYGKFQDALIAAKLPYKQIVRKFAPGKWSKKLVHLALRALYENGYAPKYLRRDLPHVEETVSNAVGFPVKPSTAYWYALDFYNQDIEKALTAAGLPAEEIVDRLKHQKVTRPQIRAGLKALFNNKIFPSSSLLLSRSAEAARVLRRDSGVSISPRSFYEDTLSEHGTMLNALRDADLPVYRFVQRWHASRIVMVMTSWLDREPPRKDGSLRKSYIVRCLRRLYEAGIMYNGPMAEGSSASIVEVLSNMFGREVTSRYLFDEATRAFGTYRNALIAADLPADDIILYHAPFIDPFAHVPSQVERVWEKNRSGDMVQSRKKFLGATSITPEELMMAKQVEEQFLKCLPLEYRKDGAKILALVLSTNGEPNKRISTTIRRLARLEGISKERFEEINYLVLTNAEFKKYLTGDYDS